MTISVGKKYIKILSVLSAILVTTLVIQSFTSYRRPIGGHKTSDNILATDGWEVNDDFVFTDKNSDNITGFKSPIVPNIVHYVVLDNPYMDFIHYLSVKSVLRHHRPDQVVIHCNCNELKGKYWLKLQSTAKDRQLIRVRRIVKPERVFGHQLSSVYHMSDIARIQIMMTLGGIFLDNDVFVVKSLDFFRKFEFSIGWPPNESIGTQVLIGHRNARFPRLWYESYHKYRPNRWYYNAGQLPTDQILGPNPQLVHRVSHEFGVHNLVPMLYNDLYPFWEKNFYTIHLLSRHKSYLVPNDIVTTFNDHNIKTYNKTFGQMARLVVYGSKDPIPDQ